MDNYIIGVGVKADFSDLKDQQKAATAALKEAKSAWDDAYRELGKAADTGSAQAQAALKEYENALNEAVANEKAAQEALAAAQRASYEKRIQQSRDYQEYLAREKSAQEAAGAAIGHSVPQMAAASSALRELEGNFSHNIRAAERFLTTTLGLGPALSAAFPIIGALALGGVIFEISKSLVKFGVDADELSRELGTGWLEGAIAKMTGLGDVVKDTDKELEHLARDLDSIRAKDDQNAVQFARLTGGPGAGQEEEVSQIQKRIAALQVLAKVQKDAVDEYTRQANLPVNSAEYGREGEMGQLKAKQNLKLAQEQYNTTLATEEELRGKIFNLIVEAGKAQDTAATKAAKQSESAAEKERRARGEAVREMLKIDEDAAKEQKRITDEVQADGIRVLKEEEEAQKRAGEAEIREQREAKAIYEEKLRAQEEAAKAQLENATDSIDQKIRDVKDQGSTGEISGAQELSELQSLLNQKFAIENAYYDQLESLYIKDSAKWQAIENQREAANRKIADEQAAVAQKVADDQLRAYERAAQGIGSAMLSTMDRILMGQVNIAHGAEQMASRMLISFINSMAQQLLKHGETRAAELAIDAVHWVRVNILHSSSIATGAVQDAAANATKVAAAIPTNVAIATSDAAVAAAAALASTSAIPITGPFMAPGVAAGIYTTGMAFAGLASAAGGWSNVPSDTLALIHKREMVLPASIAEGARRTFASGGASGQSINYAPTVNGAGNDREIKRVLKSSSREVAEAARRAIRNGHL